MTAGQIAIGLWVFPIITWIAKILSRWIKAIGKKLGVNEIGSAGRIASLANHMAIYNILFKPAQWPKKQEFQAAY